MAWPPGDTGRCGPHAAPSFLISDHRAALTHNPGLPDRPCDSARRAGVLPSLALHPPPLSNPDVPPTPQPQHRANPPRLLSSVTTPPTHQVTQVLPSRLVICQGPRPLPQSRPRSPRSLCSRWESSRLRTLVSQADSAPFLVCGACCRSEVFCLSGSLPLIFPFSSGAFTTYFSLPRINGFGLK